MNTNPSLSLLSLSILLAGCAVGPDYQRPQVALTGHYQAAAPAPQGKAVDLDAWWRGFDDPALLRIVDRALAQNLDLEQARARVLQSRARVQQAGAALLPRGEAAAGVNDVRQSLRSPIGALASELPGFERDYDDYRLGASAAWELDLFGGLRRGREAALADARATRSLADGVRLSIVADAADAYLRVRELQARLGLARRQQGVQSDLAGLVARRHGEGLSSDRDLHEAKAASSRVAATIPPLLAGLDAQLNRLDVLMGAQPGTYRAELEAVAPLPAAPVPSTLDTPADLLRRRPDVIAAEARLAAANARIGAAIAEYYPKVSLSALLGVQSIAWSQVASGSAVEHDLGVGLRWRLFDFGRVDAEVAQARGREAEALAGYRATVLRAAEDVENAVSRFAHNQARVNELGREVDQLARARGLAQLAYDGGAVTLLDVRDTDRNLLTASDQLAQARGSVAVDAVALFRALGGGWKAGAPTRMD